MIFVGNDFIFFFLILLGKCFYFLLLEYENSYKFILFCKKLLEIFKVN